MTPWVCEMLVAGAFTGRAASEGEPGTVLLLGAFRVSGPGPVLLLWGDGVIPLCNSCNST